MHRPMLLPQSEGTEKTERHHAFTFSLPFLYLFFISCSYPDVIRSCLAKASVPRSGFRVGGRGVVVTAVAAQLLRPAQTILRDANLERQSSLGEPRVTPRVTSFDIKVTPILMANCGISNGRDLFRAESGVNCFVAPVLCSFVHLEVRSSLLTSC